MDSLSSRQIENAVMYPTIRVASRPGQLLMGVYDGAGEFVADTTLDRRAGEQGAPMPRDLFPVVTNADVPEAIYAGPLYFHYGHFLLESLARVWYAQTHPDVPLVWAGQYNWQTSELTPWQLEILDILGITNPVRILADPTRFDLLHDPEIGYRYDDRFHPQHAEFLARYEGPAQEPGHRLWLSRTKVVSEARDLNSGSTERRLAEAGWTIAYPENLNVHEQLDQLSRAEIIAGEEGSAFHALMLMKDVAAKEFHVFRRLGREHGNLHTVGDARGVNQSFYSLKRERVIKAEGRYVTKVNPNSSEILDILKVPVPPAGAAGSTPDDAVLEQLLSVLEPRTLLEVGSCSPRLTFGSATPDRVAVSPQFDFDPRAYASKTFEFYELELKQYADLFHADRGRFDVILMTGAGFREVLAAFRICKSLGRDNTVYVLGSGETAARAALGIRKLHPGYTAERVFIHRTSVYLARRVPDEPKDEFGIEKLLPEQVRSRSRLVRPVSLRRLQKRRRP